MPYHKYAGSSFFNGVQLRQTNKSPPSTLSLHQTTIGALYDQETRYELKNDVQGIADVLFERKDINHKKENGNGSINFISKTPYIGIWPH